MIRTSVFTAAISLVAFAGVSNAAPVPWNVPAGSQSTYDYSNGQSLNGNFGDGLAIPTGFLFFPSNLAANATNNSSASLSDTASVVLTTHSGQNFTNFTASLVGFYSILGDGDINSTAQLKITNLDTMAVELSALTFTPSMPQAGGTGVFTAVGNVMLPSGWTNVGLDLDASVLANAGEGSSAFIQIENGSIGVETAVIPLPAAVLAAPIAGAIAWRARRKLVRKA